MTKELKGFMCKISDVKFSSKFFSSIKGTASKKRGGQPQTCWNLPFGDGGNGGKWGKFKTSKFMFRENFQINYSS